MPGEVVPLTNEETQLELEAELILEGPEEPFESQTRVIDTKPLQHLCDKQRGRLAGRQVLGASVGSQAGTARWQSHMACG